MDVIAATFDRRTVLADRLAAGEDRAALLEELDGERLALQGFADKEDEWEVVMNLMDMLTGYCSPHVRL